MTLEYIFLRLIRKFIPSFVINALLKRNFILEAAQGTNNPVEAVNNYEKRINNFDYQGKIILELGYGGCFGTAAEFLTRGAKYIYLIDKYAKPDEQRNLKIYERYPQYFYQKNNKILPNEKYLKVITDDIVNWSEKNKIKTDLILSSAVFEHIENVDKTVSVLQKIMTENGRQSHYIDLSDHFRKYPFAMFCYSDWFWQFFLKPREHLNRFRAMDYVNIFKKYFNKVEYLITVKDLDNFLRVKNKIKRKFLTGNDEVDSVKAMLIIVS